MIVILSFKHSLNQFNQFVHEPERTAYIVSEKSQRIQLAAASFNSNSSTYDVQIILFSAFSRVSETILTLMHIDELIPNNKFLSATAS